jgi:hypothetical protein
MIYWQKIKAEIDKFKNLGEEKTENGTSLIGRAPHIAKFAWLHSIYLPLTAQDIITLENELKTEIPSDYKLFLTNFSNGLTLFVNKFYLYGLRKQIGRTVEASRQPYSPMIANVDERPSNAKDTYFFIGGYSWDGSRLYIDKKSNHVHYCDRWDASSLYEWCSFEEMLVLEVKRITSLFDEKGIIKDRNKYTTPIPREMK